MLERFFLKNDIKVGYKVNVIYSDTLDGGKLF